MSATAQPRAAAPTSPPAAAAIPRVLVLGIGNLLWADEGFGVRCVEALAARHRFPPGVRLLDGGTQGIYLVDQVRDADVLVVFDAVDYGLPPGTLKRVEGDEVPRFLGAKKMSLHQTGFQEVLALAALLGDYPQHLLLIGVQPVELDDFGGSLRPAVKARIEPALALALDYLAGFDIRPIPVMVSTTFSNPVSALPDPDPDPTCFDPSLPPPALTLTAYERAPYAHDPCAPDACA